MRHAIAYSTSVLCGSRSIRASRDVSQTAEALAHNLLRILRELASNAVRHGHAAKIRVAGAVENGNLLVSVSDNGCGFDIAEAPGIDQGHFGLEGISERIETMGGSFTLESSPGHGCRAVIRMPVPKESEAR